MSFDSHACLARRFRRCLQFSAVLLLALTVPACESTREDEIPSEPEARSGCASEETHQGVATWYRADGTGACSFDPSPDDLLVAAMNQAEYGEAAYCGACAEVKGPAGDVTVRIVDLCPSCSKGALDLSREAFARIAQLSAGRVPIAWTVVPCPVGGPISYHFKEGSNRWWSAIQVRNHRHRIARFEYRASNGSWRSVARKSYNYFVEPSGMGPGPYSFRVTDVHDHALIDLSVPFVEGGEVSGAGQFPSCR
jgi:expansin (peptidoglycan-binding protein)